MAARRNVFELLEVDDDRDNLVSLASTVTVRASSVSSFVSSSAPQRNSDREKGSDKWHGSERNNRNNVQANGYRKNNGGGRSFNGYQKKLEITNGNEKKEGQSEDEDGWQVVSKSNGKKQRKAAMDDQGRNYNQHHLKESGTNIVCNGCGEKGRFESEREDERGAGEESPSPTEKEVQKPNNAGSQRGETESSKGNDDDNKVVSKEETERRARIKEGIERRALEARQMNLKQYEKKLEEDKKKKKSLENMKTEERRVALDKELESIQMIERNKEETSFMKNSATDKLKHKKKKKKKAADNGNAHMEKYLVVPPRRPHPCARRNDGGSIPPPVIVKKDAPPPLSFQDADQFPALGLDGSRRAKS